MKNVTGRHMRAARALLDWSRADLEGRSGVSQKMIQLWETQYEDVPVPPGYGALERAVKALEEGGVKFINGEHPGVKLVK